MKLTVVEQRKNLIKLAEHLEQLPEDYRDFSMTEFYSGHDRGYVISGFKYCGTAACALGHGPAAGIVTTKEEFFFTRDHFDWLEYSRELFGLDPASPEWDWLFSDSWTCVDNTHYGAAARIWSYLDGVFNDYTVFDSRLEGLLDTVVSYQRYHVKTRKVDIEAIKSGFKE